MNYPPAGNVTAYTSGVGNGYLTAIRGGLGSPITGFPRHFTPSVADDCNIVHKSCVLCSEIFGQKNRASMKMWVSGFAFVPQYSVTFCLQSTRVTHAQVFTVLL